MQWPDCAQSTVWRGFNGYRRGTQLNQSHRARTANTHWALTLVFDKAVDVVESEHFSNLRRQVNCTVGPDRRSSAKTSDGQTQVVLEG